MQQDRFTTKVREAFADAQRLATQRRNTEVAPAHLLAALIGSEDGMTAPILRKVGADSLAIEQGALALVDDLPTLSGSEPLEPRFSPALARVLQRAEREMSALGDEYVASNHLLLALAEKSSGVAGVLPEREALAKAASDVITQRITTADPESTLEALDKFGQDLTADAEAGRLDPVIGRDEEIRRVVQVLSRRTKNNPVLIGDPGVGKTAIAEGLAQRIVAGDVPDSLKGRRLVALDVGGAARRGEVPGRVRGAAQGRAQGGQGRRRPDRPVHRRAAPRSWAPARPRERSTPPTCSSRCSLAASCGRSARPRSTSFASTSKRTPRWSAASSPSSSASPTWLTRSRSSAGSRSATRATTASRSPTPRSSPRRPCRTATSLTASSPTRRST